MDVPHDEGDAATLHSAARADVTSMATSAADTRRLDLLKEAISGPLWLVVSDHFG
jgi:hypothetical protein